MLNAGLVFLYEDAFSPSRTTTTLFDLPQTPERKKLSRELADRGRSLKRVAGKPAPSCVDLTQRYAPPVREEDGELFELFERGPDPGRRQAR